MRSKFVELAIQHSNSVCHHHQRTHEQSPQADALEQLASALFVICEVFRQVVQYLGTSQHYKKLLRSIQIQP